MWKKWSKSVLLTGALILLMASAISSVSAKAVGNPKGEIGFVLLC